MYQIDTLVCIIMIRAIFVVPIQEDPAFDSKIGVSNRYISLCITNNSKILFPLAPTDFRMLFHVLARQLLYYVIM